MRLNGCNGKAHQLSCHYAMKYWHDARGPVVAVTADGIARIKLLAGALAPMWLRFIIAPLYEVLTHDP